MDNSEIKSSLELLIVFADEKRLNILNVIGDKKLSGVDILEQMPMPQPTLSYHLKILCDNKILNAEDKWRWTYYSINNDGIEKAINILKQLEVTK